MRYQRQLNEALHDAAEALRAVAEATSERRDCGDEAEDERRRLRHCLRELRELGESLRDAVKALCGATGDECPEEPCGDETPCASAQAPLPPYPPYPPFAPYPPYPPYPPIIMLGGGCGCGGNCQGAAMGAMATAPVAAANAAGPAAPATHSVATPAMAATVRPAAALATTAGGFPDPASITDVESLLDTAESAAALVRRAIEAQSVAGGD